MSCNYLDHEAMSKELREKGILGECPECGEKLPRVHSREACCDGSDPKCKGYDPFELVLRKEK